MSPREPAVFEARLSQALHVVVAVAVAVAVVVVVVVIVVVVVVYRRRGDLSQIVRVMKLLSVL